MEPGEKITFEEGRLVVPDRPIIPYIEGDGIGPDIWRASVQVFDRSVELCWPDKRRIVWKEVLAGEKAHYQTGEWLPPDTVDAFQEYRVGIKGPLTTPVGKGIRSLNVALRQTLDLYACIDVLRIFPKDHHVHLVGFPDRTGDTREIPNGPHAGV